MTLGLASDLVSPVAEVRGKPRRVTRPASLEGTVALVNSTVNSRSFWGAGMLDGAEQALAARFPGLLFERVQRPIAHGMHPSDLWAQSMVERFSALVISAGDCASCLSHSVCDVANLEELGVPAMLVINGPLNSLAAGTAELLGLDLAYVPAPVMLHGLSREQIATAIVQDADAIVAALSSPSPRRNS